MNRWKSAPAVLLSLLAGPSFADCGPNSFEVCVITCWCQPNSGTVIENSPAGKMVEAVQKYTPPVFTSLQDAVPNLVDVIKAGLSGAWDGFREAEANMVAGAAETARNVQRETARFGGELQVASSAIVEYAKDQASGASTVVQGSVEKAREGRAIDALWELAVGRLRVTEDSTGKAVMRSEYLRAVGQVAASSYGGPGGAAAYAAWLAYRQTPDPNIAIRAGLIVGATSLAMGGAGQIDDSTKRALVAGAIGGTAVAAAGGSEDAVKEAFLKGAAMVVIQDGYRQYTGHEMDGKAATGKAYCASATQTNCQPYPQEAIVGKDSDGNLIIDRTKLDPSASFVGSKDPSAFFNETNKAMEATARVPGMNALAIFHDEWAIKWDMGAFSTPATIIPAVVVTYTGFGVQLYDDIRATSVEHELARLAQEIEVEKQTKDGQAPAALPSVAWPMDPAKKLRDLPDFGFLLTQSDRLSSRANIMRPIDAVLCETASGVKYGALFTRSFGPGYCSEGTPIYRSIKNTDIQVLDCLKPFKNMQMPPPDPYSSCRVTVVDRDAAIAKQYARKIPVPGEVFSIDRCIDAFRAAIPKSVPSGDRCVRASSQFSAAFAGWTVKQPHDIGAKKP